jgi:hypothetical protein
MNDIAAHEHALLNYAIPRLADIPGLRLIGTAPDKTSVMSFILDGHEPEEVGKALDTDGIAARSGHHCAPPILRRYGLDATVRPSPALYNTREERSTPSSTHSRDSPPDPAEQPESRPVQLTNGPGPGTIVVMMTAAPLFACALCALVCRRHIDLMRASTALCRA